MVLSLQPGRARAFVCLSAIALVSCATPAPQREVRIEPKVEVSTFDAAGQPTSGRDLAELVWGMGPDTSDAVDWAAVDGILDGRGEQDPPGDQDPSGEAGETTAPPESQGGEPADVQDPAEQQAERLREEARLRIAFGDTILINGDGTITKQYFLAQDASKVFLNLLAPIGSIGDPSKAPQGAQNLGGEQVNSLLGRMLGKEHEVELVYVGNFEQFQNMVPRSNPKAQAKPVGNVANSLLLVTAKPSALRAFEETLNSFYVNLPQVEIEVKVFEYTLTDTTSFGVTPVDANTPTLRPLRQDKLIQDITSTFPLRPPFAGSGTSDQGLITLGGIHDSWELNAAIQALETSNLVDVKSQPKMVVRNGGTATVSTTTDQPFPQAKISNQTVTTSSISFKPVGVVMDIRPEIAGTETVVLNIYVSVSAISSFAPSEPVPTPIISTREAATSVHLRVGESTVIGGLISENIVESESKIPILGDIPLLGYLFRSTATQDQKTVLEFHITPRILRGPRAGRSGL